LIIPLAYTVAQKTVRMFALFWLFTSLYKNG